LKLLCEKFGILNFSFLMVFVLRSLFFFFFFFRERRRSAGEGFARARARLFLSLSRRLEQRGVLTPLRENRIIDRIVASLFLFLF
tara:strand:+ start:1562 stop:1816 length:255 start_codon:yes stop_codon:yes gene_type:complete